MQVFNIFSDNDGVVEFREKKSTLYKLSFATIIGGAFLIIFAAIRSAGSNFEYEKLINYFLFDSLGLLFVAFGITSLFFRRLIIVNQISNELFLVLGIRRYLRRPKKIPLSQSSHIEIKPKLESSIGAIPMDYIYLVLKDNSRIKIEYSELHQYTNEFCRSLSDTIGCNLYR